MLQLIKAYEIRSVAGGPGIEGRRGVVYQTSDETPSRLLYWDGQKHVAMPTVAGAALDGVVSGAWNPRIASQVARIGIGSNYVYTNNGNAGDVPTVICPRNTTLYTSSDVLLPAQVGDRIEFLLLGRISTAAGAGLVLSIWSCGGKQYRDVGSGLVGLQTVPGVATIAAGATASQRLSASYVVHPDDIDENGFVLFRLFGANAAAGPATHTFIGSASSGTPFRWFGANVRRDASATPSLKLKYPTGVAGADLAFQTLGGAFGTVSAVDPTGASDVVVPATALDVLRFELDMRYTAATNMRWIVGIVKDGSFVRNVLSQSTTLDTNGPLLDSASGTATIGATAVVRVRDTDIASDGTVTLRLYACAASGTGTQSHTIRGSDSVGGYSNFRVFNYGSPFRWAITPTYAGWDSGPTTAAGSQQECDVWQDTAGRWHMIYTATPGNYMGWAWCDDIEKGVWTKYPSPILGNGVGGVPGAYNRGSVLYENGIVYIYSRGYAGGGIGCCYGPSPASLTNAGAVLASAPAGYTTLENSGVVKGSDGAYWMWFEGIHTATAKWQIGLAKSTSPLGPFVHVAAPLTSLQVIANGTANSPDPTFNGRTYQVVHHAAPNATLSVPSMVYSAKSVDGQSWNRLGVGADGTPNGVLQPLYELGQAQTADPTAVVYNGRTYLFVTAQENGSPEKGGIMVTDPLAWPIPYGT